MSLLQQKLLELRETSDKGVKDITHDTYRSYEEIFKRSERYSHEFSKSNQEIISVVLPNSIEYLEVMIACLMTGNIFNPIPYFTSDDELNRIFKYVKPRLVVSDRKKNSKKKNSISFINPEDIKDVSSDKENNFEDSSIEGSKIASLYYSSGTTGSPKGVLYSHDNVYYLIESIIRGFGFTKETKHFSILPFGHTASINYNIFPSFFLQSEMIIAESFTNIAPRFFKIISNEEINYVQVVPTIVYMLLKIRYKIDDLNLSSLMFLGCGSSILPLESQIQFEKKFNIRIGNLYGLSETGPTHIDDPRADDWIPGTIGIPLDVNECKLSEDSEVLIKGKNVFTGYYKNEALYDEVVKDGWFHTGDLADYENGKFIYKDRSKDLIIKGGINIVPAEIEEVLYMEEEVLESAVVGVFNEVHGEEIIAAVSLKDQKADQEAIKAKLYVLLASNLSSYKHPIDIIFLESLPKTHSGKLKRREVRSIAEDEYNK